MSQSKCVFWICEQRIKLKNPLGLCSSKVVLNDKREKVKKIECQNSCSLECFSGFSIRCRQFSVNLWVWNTESSPICQVSAASLPPPSRALRAPIQMRQRYVIHSVSKGQSLPISWLAFRLDAYSMLPITPKVPMTQTLVYITLIVYW